MSNRKSLDKDIVKMLLARSGNRCAMPGCSSFIYNDRNILIGEFAHINAVNANGPRYDSSLNAGYVNSYENILLLCPNHHTEIDKDYEKYSVPVLQKIKTNHEIQFKEISIPSEMIEAAVSKYLNELKVLLQENGQTYNDISNKLISILNIISRPVEQLYNFPEHSEQIKKLKEQGAHKAVLSLLESFKEKHWNELTDEEKYKWHVNLALTYFDLSDNFNASKLLKGLLEYSYKTDGTNGLISLGFLMSHDLAGAEKYAMVSISESPQDPNGYITLIRINAGNRGSKIKFEIPDSIKNDVSIQIALAKAHEENNEFEEACRIYSAIDIEAIPENLLKNDLKSYHAIALVQSIPHLELIYKGSRKEEDIQKVNKALTLFDECIEYYKNTDLFPSRFYTLINRGVLYKILGDIERAELEFSWAVNLNPSFITYRYLMMNRSIDDWPPLIKACRALELTPDEKIELSQIEAERLLFIGNANDALIVLIETQDIVAISIETNENYFLLLSDVYAALKNGQEIERIIDVCNSKPALKFIYLVLSLKYRNWSNDVESYNNYAELLLEETQNKNMIWARVIVFDLFCLHRDFKRAEKVFRPICTKQFFNEYSRKFIQCIFNCGYYQETAEWIKAYIDNGLADDYLIDILSSIYDFCDRVDEAIEAIKAFLLTHDSNILKIKLAFIYCGNNQLEQCREILKKIDRIERLTFENIFKISIAYIRCGLAKKGLELAYNCRMNNVDNPSAHSIYIQAITSNCLSLPEYRSPEKVILNSYVSLNSQNSGVKEIVITQQAKHPDELSIEDDLAISLLGNVVGFKLTWEGIEYTVEKILTKYAFALNKSLELFATTFNDPTLQVNKTDSTLPPEEQAQAFLSSLQQATFEEQAFIVAAYQDGLPYEVISKKLGENIVSYWEKQISNTILPLIALNGFPEVERFDSQVKPDSELIFDFLSILILSFSYHWELIENLPNKKYVTSSVLRVIEYELTDIDQHITFGEFYVVKPEHETFVKKTITIDDLKRRRAHFEALKTKIIEQFIVIPTEIPSDFGLKVAGDEIFGHCGNDILKAANEKGLIVISEDFIYREKLKTQFSIVTGSTASLSYHLFKKGLIAREFHDNYSLTLVGYNYIGILTNENVLKRAFDKDGASIGPTVRRVLYILRTIALNERVKICVNFLKNIVSDNTLNEECILAAVDDLAKLYLYYENSYESKTLLSNRINSELKTSSQLLEKINRHIDKQLYGTI